MITRLLVANRGEIAGRVFATCRRLGIETVAVHSDADAGLPFVAEADHAVRLPGNAPAETYLRAELILEAARSAGADAIHPGYGFLSENAAFARAVIEAGLTWVGPAPESIEAMGSKIEAKRLMEAAGVPVLTAPDQPTDSDLPLLVKASAGGGGRGMRIVRQLDALAGEIERAASEAESAFGDGTVFVEPYVEHGRHVEVQVVGHRDGVLVLGERDCSIQRRHQKVVEESPAPGLSSQTRVALHDAARKAATAIDYAGAGTVEFLLDADDPTRFWFLEMNTRLQVEHPVTECVTGRDLVELQLAVAEGRSVDTEEPAPRGHAVEVRLYAEDPAADWQPQSGLLEAFEIACESRFAVPTAYGVRVDSGFAGGNEVSTHYDAMLAKVIVWAPTRDQAMRQLAGALSRARIHGVRTNRDLLVAVLGHPEVVAGRVSTDFFDRFAPDSLVSRDAAVVQRSALAAALGMVERAASHRPVQQRIPAGWRNVTSQPQSARFVLATDGEAEPIEAHWYGGRDGYATDDPRLRVLAAGPDRVVLDHDGVATSFEVRHRAGSDLVDVDSPHGHVGLRRLPRFTDPADQVAEGSLLAPMPGTVVSVLVEQGASVRAGTPLLVLEAMKMQHTVAAPTDGTVSDLQVSPGDQVAAGAVLAVVDPHESADESAPTEQGASA